MTRDLFMVSQERSKSFQRFELPDAEVELYPSLFSSSEADSLLEDLVSETDWRQENIKLYGRVHKVPRLTAWYGDPGKTYRYSGITVKSTGWSPGLLAIKKRIEAISRCSFNTVLLNYYRDGSDSMSWHADDEPELGPNPIIGSVSLGQSRVLQMKHKTDKAQKQAIPLPHGSLLLMKGAVQHHWLHQVAKSKREMGPRVNLTYRFVL